MQIFGADSDGGGQTVDLFADARERFLRAILGRFPPPAPRRVRVLVITHCVEDRPSLIRAMGSAYDVAAIIPIPYSANRSVVRELAREHTVLELSLDQLGDRRHLGALTSRLIAADDTPLVVMEIGGYHAHIGARLRAAHGSRFVGCVESTEQGHREYLAAFAAGAVSFGVVSVARSPFKAIEARFTGDAIMFSVERFARSLGLPLTGLVAGVLGYGVVGREVARSAAGRASGVLVHDYRLDRQDAAAAAGFGAVERNVLLRSADVVIGCTGSESVSGEDVDALRPGAILASGTSKQVELDVAGLRRAAASREQVISGVERLRLPDGRSFFLLAEGHPVNFVDGAVVGPAMSLVHGEILAALAMLVRGAHDRGIGEVSDSDRRWLHEEWERHFPNATLLTPG